MEYKTAGNFIPTYLDFLYFIAIISFSRVHLSHSYQIKQANVEFSMNELHSSFEVSKHASLSTKGHTERNPKGHTEKDKETQKDILKETHPGVSLFSK